MFTKIKHPRNLALIETTVASEVRQTHQSFNVRQAADTLQAAAPGWFDQTQGSATRQTIAVVLGSGLGGLAEVIEDVVSISYDQIPGLASTTAAGHRGAFLMGNFGQSRIIAMAGRLHAYEGHSLESLTRPMALMASLNPQAVIVSCAAGGLNPRYRAGDVVVIDEHLSFLHGRLGGGPVVGGLAVGSPGVHESEWPANRIGLPTCDETLAELAVQAARASEFSLHRGTYLATTGPNYETRAECRMMRSWGVDLVGMSTVPEVVLASRVGLRTLAVGVVTNMAVPDAPQTASHDEVLAVSSAAGAKLQAIVRQIADHDFVRQIADHQFKKDLVK